MGFWIGLAAPWCTCRCEQRSPVWLSATSCTSCVARSFALQDLLQAVPPCQSQHHFVCLPHDGMWSMPRRVVRVAAAASHTVASQYGITHRVACSWAWLVPDSAEAL